MRERGVLFSAPMVRAILADRKTQTRRVVKDQSSVSDLAGGGVEPAVWWPRRQADGDPRSSPYGMRGDRLWVRETWGVWKNLGGGFDVEAVALEDARKQMPWAAIQYRANELEEKNRVFRWRPAIHMPRWASRITLVIVDVRVERLLDISEEDARAEGITVRHEGCWSHPLYRRCDRPPRGPFVPGALGRDQRQAGIVVHEPMVLAHYFPKDSRMTTLFVVLTGDGRETEYKSVGEAFALGKVIHRRWDEPRRYPEVWIRTNGQKYGPVLRP